MAIGGVLGLAREGAGALGIKIPSVKGLFKGAFNSIFGGRKCSSEQKKNRAEVARLINQYMPISERRRLVNIAKNSPSPNGESMARFYFGGGDCYHKNVHPDDQRYLNELPVALEKAVAEAQKKELSQNETAISAGTFSGNEGVLKTVGIAFVGGLIVFAGLKLFK